MLKYYEKYTKDHEIREALQLLRNKMLKEEMEKENHLNYIKGKETIITDADKNKESESVEDKLNKILKKEAPKNNNEEVFNKTLNPEQKELLEKTWNKSTKPELGDKIINEKGDKEIVIEDKNNKIKVSFFLIQFYFVE